MTPNPLVEALGGELPRIDEALRESVRSDDDFLTEVASHLLRAGGKRERPLCCVASALATRPDHTARITEESILGGVSVELVQMGSLYHDDVMDEASTRRGVDSVNARWGNLTAILAGDFLLARASGIAARLGVEVAALLSATIGRLCEGQLAELRQLYDPSRTPEAYFAAIEGKTAALFRTSCRIGAIVGGADPSATDAVSEFGRNYGLAFQVVDDLLDIISSEAALGKPVGHDLLEGVYTLPVLLTLEGPDGDALKALLGAPLRPDQQSDAVELVRRGPGPDASRAQARMFADRAITALSTLPPSPAVDAMSGAADHLVARGG